MEEQVAGPQGTPRKHWSAAMQIIPEGWGEREEKPRSARWPRALVARLDQVAKDNEHDFTTALFHLVKWSLDEYDRQRSAEGKSTSEPRED